MIRCHVPGLMERDKLKITARPRMRAASDDSVWQRTDRYDSNHWPTLSVGMTTREPLIKAALEAAAYDANKLGHLCRTNGPGPR